jgi:hypothetical protein
MCREREVYRGGKRRQGIKDSGWRKGVIGILSYDLAYNSLE